MEDKRDWALAEIARDEQNIAELREARKEAFEKKNWRLYQQYPRDISALKAGIKGLSAYLEEGADA